MQQTCSVVWHFGSQKNRNRANLLCGATSFFYLTDLRTNIFELDFIFSCKMCNILFSLTHPLLYMLFPTDVAATAVLVSLNHSGNSSLLEAVGAVLRVWIAYSASKACTKHRWRQVIYTITSAQVVSMTFLDAFQVPIEGRACAVNVHVSGRQLIGTLGWLLIGGWAIDKTGGFWSIRKFLDSCTVEKTIMLALPFFCFSSLFSWN